ncbi:MAG: PKD domain-containing protein, partial [Candidatus Promineifilaceae bacterium]
IAGASGEGVVVVKTISNTVLHRIPNLGGYPVDVIFGRDGDVAYVSNRDTVDDIVIIDTATYTAVGTIDVPDSYLGPGKMAVNQCSGDLYAVNWYDDHFYLIDTVAEEVTSDITLGNSLWDLTIDPSASTLYITDRGLDAVHVFDIAALTSTLSIPVGQDPWGVDITPDGRLVFVTNEDSHDVSIIDTSLNVVTDTVTFAADVDPRDVDITADGQYAYVTSGDITGNDKVYIIDVTSHAVVDDIEVDSTNTNALAVAPNFAGQAPTAAFTYTMPAVANMPVQFTDQSTTGPSAWAWDFGDGGMSSDQNPMHTYNAGGTYSVTLTASNACGGTSTSMVIEVGSGMADVYLPAVLKQ